MSFPAFALGEIFDIARGGSPRPIYKFITDDPNGVNWISISDASSSSKYITKANRKIIPSGVARSRTVRPGDFLLTNSMSFGRPYIMATSGCIHDGWLVLSPRKDGIDNNFMYHLLGSPAVYAEFKRLAPGATVKNLNIDLVSGVEVPLPPLDEQRRIATILDQADTLRRKRREEIGVLGRLSQSIYGHMFGDPVNNPKNWPSKPLTEVCHCYSGGTPSKSNDAYWQGSLPWFSAKDLKEDDLFDSIDHIDPEVTESTSLKLLSPNTVAIVVRGMILAHTFQVCVLRIPATINQDLKALLPREPIDAQFLAATLRAQASFVLQQVSEAGHGTKRLDAEALGKINIILPPIEMRQAYTDQVTSIQAQMDLQRKSLEKFDNLFASLQHRAFRGEL